MLKLTKLLFLLISLFFVLFIKLSEASAQESTPILRILNEPVYDWATRTYTVDYEITNGKPGASYALYAFGSSAACKRLGDTIVANCLHRTQALEGTTLRGQWVFYPWIEGRLGFSGTLVDWPQQDSTKKGGDYYICLQDWAISGFDCSLSDAGHSTAIAKVQDLPPPPIDESSTEECKKRGLTISTNKREYSPGENIEVTMNISDPFPTSPTSKLNPFFFVVGAGGSKSENSTITNQSEIKATIPAQSITEGRYNLYLYGTEPSGNPSSVCQINDAVLIQKSKDQRLALEITNNPLPPGDSYNVKFKLSNAKPGATYFFFPEEVSTLCTVANAAVNAEGCSAIAGGIVNTATFEGEINFNSTQVPGFGELGKTHKICAMEANLGAKVGGFPIKFSVFGVNLIPIENIQALLRDSSLSCGNDETHATADVTTGGTEHTKATCIATPIQEILKTAIICNNLGADTDNKGARTASPLACENGDTPPKKGLTCPTGMVFCAKVANDMDRKNAPDSALICKKVPETALGATNCNPKTGKDDPNGTGIKTAIGCVPTEPAELVQGIITFSTFAGGGIALIIMVIASIGMITSLGNAEKLKASQEQFAAAIIGLLFIIFSVLLLQIIGIDILNLPGFTK